jgi:hypothetical protein
MAASNDPTSTQQWAGHLKHTKLRREMAEAAKARRQAKARRKREGK